MVLPVFFVYKMSMLLEVSVCRMFLFKIFCFIKFNINTMFNIIMYGIIDHN